MKTQPTLKLAIEEAKRASKNLRSDKVLWLMGNMISLMTSLVPSHLVRKLEPENAIKIAIGSSNMAGPREKLPVFDGNKVKWMSL